VLHVCSSNCFLEELAEIDYPAPLVSWEAADPTNPPLDKAEVLLKDRVMVGGADHNGWLLKGEPQEVVYKVDELKERFDPTRLIIAPGCAIPPEVSSENLHAIRERLS
jgi:uroporphyrinogen decarboxylase